MDEGKRVSTDHKTHKKTFIFTLSLLAEYADCIWVAHAINIRFCWRFARYIYMLMLCFFIMFYLSTCSLVLCNGDVSLFSTNYINIPWVLLYKKTQNDTVMVVSLCYVCF